MRHVANSHGPRDLYQKWKEKVYERVRIEERKRERERIDERKREIERHNIKPSAEKSMFLQICVCVCLSVYLYSPYVRTVHMY